MLFEGLNNADISANKHYEPDYTLTRIDGSTDCNYKEILSDTDVLQLLDIIIFNRVFDERLQLLQRQGRIGFHLTSTGEEATIIGASFCLNFEDPIFLTYRELGALFVRGVPVEHIMNQFFANHGDFCKGRQMPVHYCFKEFNIPSVSSPVGTQLPHACGFAYASKFLNTGQVALGFLGEGTASSNDFHAALNFAGVFQAPVIFVIRNNGYAISTPESLQTVSESLAIRAEGYGIKGVQIDGNDMLMVVKTMKKAIERAKAGKGPTLIEAMTYRMGAHSSSDDPSAYRDKGEPEHWKAYGPLIRLTQHAKWRGIWSDKLHDEKVKSHTLYINGLIESSETLASPSVNSLFEDVYKEMPKNLKEQKNSYLNYLKKLELKNDASI